MRTIAADRFKNECLSILDNVDPDGIIITKRGKPIARLLPIRDDSGRPIRSTKNRIIINGDIYSTGVKWNAESRKK
ncbi:MAG: type II toxin-antitoxin system Phd/YefM family antitoxin [Planctomycetes bacterium]|nr:type II toxin-antitoxin system Phd/YefM family antitoxin [Planctomycetota bacterium]